MGPLLRRQPGTAFGAGRDPALATAWPALCGIAATVATVLVATSGRYGYHRDELYFLQAGQHLAIGYVDQPPLTPLAARAMSELFGDSLVALRFPSAVTAGLVVLLTGLIARELGAGRAAQALAAACMAVSAFLLAVGHLLSTSTFDLLAWTALSWLLVRGLRDGGPVWIAAGAVAGIGLQNKALVAFLLAGLGVGLLVVGPREVPRSRWPWIGLVITLALGRRTCCGRRPTGGRNSSSRPPSPPAVPARVSRGGSSCHTSLCWSARCWSRCGSPGCGG